MEKKLLAKRELETIMEEWHWQATRVLQENIEELTMSWRGEAAGSYVHKLYQLQQRMEKISASAEC